MNSRSTTSRSRVSGSTRCCGLDVRGVSRAPGSAADPIRSGGAAPSFPTPASCASTVAEKGAGEFACRDGTAPPKPNVLAGLLYVCLSAFSTRPPSGFIVVSLLLIPIPFLLVQHRFNRSWRGARAPFALGGVPRLSVLRTAFVAVGICCVGAAFCTWIGRASIRHRYALAPMNASMRPLLPVAVPSASFPRLPPHDRRCQLGFQLHALSRCVVVSYVSQPSNLSHGRRPRPRARSRSDVHQRAAALVDRSRSFRFRSRTTITIACNRSPSRRTIQFEPSSRSSAGVPRRTLARRGAPPSPPYTPPPRRIEITAIPVFW